MEWQQSPILIKSHFDLTIFFKANAELMEQSKDVFQTINAEYHPNSFHPDDVKIFAERRKWWSFTSQQEFG
jgi:hypothetical protein